MATGGSDKIKCKVLEPRRLSDEEDFTSYCEWKTSVLYTLRREPRFIRFLDGEAWTIKTENPQDNRGLVDDPNAAANGVTADVKASHLRDFLSVLSQFAPHFLSAKIQNSSTGVDSIFRFIREYYTIQQSESSFMKLLCIQREPNERPMRLYHRLLSHINDSLLTKETSLLYNEQVYGQNEVMSPTLERWVVLRWLELLHPQLPAAVQRYFSHELRKRTLVDLQPQICDAMEDLLNQLNTEPADIGYVPSARGKRRSRSGPPEKFHQSGPVKPYKSKETKIRCPICRKLGQPAKHPVKDCPTLSWSDKQDLAQAFSVQVHLEEVDSDSSSSEEHTE